MGSFNPNLKTYELKIHRVVICHDNEELCKIWRRTDLSFQSWHEEFDEFWPEHLKISQIFILMGSFWAEYIFFELKKYWGVIFYETEEGYENKATEIFVTIENVFFYLIFSLTHLVFDFLIFIYIYIYIYILFKLKKYRRVIFHRTEEGYKIWRGIDLLFQDCHKEFEKFGPEHSKVSKSFILMGSLWGKYILFELKK